MTNIVFNPSYHLKPDVGRALLFTKKYGRNDTYLSDSAVCIIHPTHASILSLLTGDEYTNSIKKVSVSIGVSEQSVKKFIDALLDSDRWVKIKLSDKKNLFLPPKLIISSNKKREELFSIKDFNEGELDLSSKRHKTPSDIMFMLTNKCMTNCCYCYADRRTKTDCSLSFERIKEIIIEANRLGVRSFDVIGGEFFLYNNWFELLKILHENDFYPYISTKIPLNKAQIIRFKRAGNDDIQISLDTMIGDNLKKILGVSDSYINKLRTTFEELQNNKIDVYVHSIICKYNDSINDIKSIFKFLSNYNNIKSWKLDIASPSMYLPYSYDTIKPNSKNFDMISDYINTLKDPIFKIKKMGQNPLLIKSYFEQSFEEKQRQFDKRASCSGNFSSLFILPDGKVTICEELYWHPKFIIGDLSKESLVEVWDSKKAHSLYNISQSSINKNSPCKTCSEYNNCRATTNRFCWKETVKAFGQKNWDYPDPMCPKAFKITSY